LGYERPSTIPSQPRSIAYEARHQPAVSKENVMKSTITVAMMAALALSAVVAQADAGTRDPRVNARQHNQRDRIQQGVRSGELTRRETRNVAEDQRDIRQLERAYKSDGQLTGAERVDLRHEQNQASREIYREKHDGQDRPAVAPAVRDPGVNQRQGNQTGRIVQGVKSGELTKAEAQELRTERKDIRELEQGYKSDGALTREERTDLHQQLNQQSREIYEEKHDGEARTP
jgi:Skp family chaperone for outer membrane proteins